LKALILDSFLKLCYDLGGDRIVFRSWELSQFLLSFQPVNHINLSGLGEINTTAGVMVGTVLHRVPGTGWKEIICPAAVYTAAVAPPAANWAGGLFLVFREVLMCMDGQVKLKCEERDGESGNLCHRRRAAKT